MPTKARTSPRGTVRQMSLRTISPSAYWNHTWSNSIRSRKVPSARASGRSVTAGWSARTSKIRSADGAVCWARLAIRESFRTGPYSISVAVTKEKSAPGVMSPWTTRKPPYQRIAMTPTAARTSISGSVSSSTRWSLSDRPSSFWLIRSKRSRSCSSRPNALTILVPASTSWSSVVRAAICSWVRRLIR